MPVIQTDLPQRYRDNRAFLDALTLPRQIGCDGVELNIRDPCGEDPTRRVLLGFSMFATRLAVRSDKLSLATTDEAV